jgi:hypothetical protein
MSVGFILPLPAPFQGQRGLVLAFERLRRVLLVSELDHRLTLLEPFKRAHKGKFVSLTAFGGDMASAYRMALFMRHCSMH